LHTLRTSVILNPMTDPIDPDALENLLTAIQIVEAYRPACTRLVRELVPAGRCDDGVEVALVGVLAALDRTLTDDLLSRRLEDEGGLSLCESVVFRHVAMFEARREIQKWTAGVVLSMAEPVEN
jgi:hypothetical protein